MAKVSRVICKTLLDIPFHISYIMLDGAWSSERTKSEIWKKKKLIGALFYFNGDFGAYKLS